MAASRCPRPGRRLWQVLGPVNGYSHWRAAIRPPRLWPGRSLRLLDQPSGCPRLRVRTLDDGYPCWIALGDLLALGHRRGAARGPMLHSTATISARIPGVLAYAQAAREQPNTYLWGAAWVPTSTARDWCNGPLPRWRIWIPRDAYLQERFCQPVAVRPGVLHAAAAGRPDLLRPSPALHPRGSAPGPAAATCTARARSTAATAWEWTISTPTTADAVATHYRQQLRGAGRVVRCHDGSPLPA
jgi:hypothetical protein